MNPSVTLYSWYPSFFPAARTPRIMLLLYISPLSSSSSPLLARHDGTGMQTALIMTFTVYTTVWSDLVWGGTAGRELYTHTAFGEGKPGENRGGRGCRTVACVKHAGNLTVPIQVKSH